MANDKFLHEKLYRGEDLLEKLSSKSIVICGAGTLGSNLIDTLARQGFSQIRVIDMDRVETHNVNTQAYDDRDNGALKVDALKNKVFHIGVEVETFGKELKPQNVKKFLKGADLVVDTFDNMASRAIVRDFCQANNIPLLHGGMFEDYGEVVWDENYTVPDDAEGRDVCEYPLSRNLATFVVSILAEEIQDFCLFDKPRLKSWSFTMQDMKISPY